MANGKTPQAEMKGLYTKVPEEFWNELNEFCKARGLKKATVLQEGFGLYKRRAERLEALAQEEDL